MEGPRAGTARERTRGRRGRNRGFARCAEGVTHLFDPSHARASVSLSARLIHYLRVRTFRQCSTTSREMAVRTPTSDRR